MKYYDNLETLKLELHFDRSEYDALTAEQKSKIKSGYLWSNYGKCWVSRSKYPNRYYAERVAKELNAGEPEKIGERLTMAERMESQAEHAENRAERYEEHAENASKRAKGLQAEFNHLRQDIAWLTQPIIAGHSGSRAFANSRNKVMARYERGFEEYKKSSYYIDRAETARQTADQAKIKNAGYLERRIAECNKAIKKTQSNIVNLENTLYKIQNGETVKGGYPVREFTADEIEKSIEKQLEFYEFEEDKLNYFEDCLTAIGGMKFSQENIKPGYIVRIGRFEETVIKANPKTVTVKSSHGFVLNYGYGDITEIVTAIEEKPKNETEPQPYKTGEILVKERPADGTPYKAYQIIGNTDKTIKIMQIAIESDKPQLNKFIDNKPITKKPTIRKWDGKWAVYEDDWQLYKYNAM